jgi:hypothetical protein
MPRIGKGMQNEYRLFWLLFQCNARPSRESLDKRGLSSGSEQERVPLAVNCL